MFEWLSTILHTRFRLIAILIAGFTVSAVLWFIVMAGIPDVRKLKNHDPVLTHLMQYRDAQYQKKGMNVSRQQRWIRLSEISPSLIQAVLISEDDKFYIHEGFDWEGIQAALEKNLSSHKILMGGSTISQQLAKNLYLTPARNPLRKIQEALITKRLEKTLSKRRILELYLNVIEWGRGIYGIEAASQMYFEKPASDLTLNEAIRLASVLPNPVRYSPVTDSSPRMLKKRRIIARRMLQKHLITETELESLAAELEGRPVPPPPAAPPDTSETVQEADSMKADVNPVLKSVME